jgi:hypothetical protein
MMSSLTPPDGGQVMTATAQTKPTVFENVPVKLVLRDHFAGLAMQALIVRGSVGRYHDNSIVHYAECRGDDVFSFDDLARDAYLAADAMLAERQKERPGE